MQQQGTGAAAPAPGQGQQQAQAAAAAAASAQQMAASAHQAAALAAMLPAAAASGAARPTLALHPALAAINPGLAAAGMLPLAGPNGTFTFAARPGMQQPFFYPAVPQPVPASAPTPASAAGAAGAAGRRLSSRPSRSSSGAAAGKKHCNCKNSRCLKLYCECFASGRYCDGCNCMNCHNNREHETTRQAAVEAILERNPNAFRPKIAGGPDSRRSGGARHNKGCNCKKSGCLKKYCECFQAGIVCSEICKCLDCKNFEGSDARDALISPQSDRNGSPMGLRRTSRTISPVPAGPMAPAPRTGFSPGSAGAPPLPGLAQLQQAQAAAAVQAAAAAAAGPRGLGADQRLAVAREAVREVVKPEVVEKVAMLLMVVSQEESDRRQAAAASPQPPGSGGGAAAAASGEAAAMDLDSEQQHEQQQGGVGGGTAGGAAAAELEAEGMEVDAAEGKGPASAAAAPPTPASDAEGGGEEEGLYEAQERLVLQEFRDTLRMISRVVGEKVEKKAAAAAAAQQQQQQMLLLPTHTPGSGGGLGLAALPHLRPGGQAGHPGVLMAAATPGQQPQLVLLPQALMAQQLAAASQQLGQAVTLQQTSQGLQAVLKSGEVLPAVSAAPLVPALVQQQQQQQQQQQPAAESATAADSDGK